MGSQRFCLRWNNHQSNLLSVFDQLLHEEAFVDVTLAVEGQFLRAHKMVLSACSPYFQALFVGHPDKHPIVILKDVPYSDMRSLLDFMYRGEVSVDQDRLTAFLKVAESLRIKGLTEVNEERCDLPSIANSLLSPNPTLTSPPHQGTPPPPNLHRIGTQAKKHPLPTPMLNSALTAPKRKRGRPRKLSGSCPGTPNPGDSDEECPRTNSVDHNSGSNSSAVMEEGSPDTKKEGREDMELDPSTPSGNGETTENSTQFQVKSEPTPGTSAQDSQNNFPGSNTQDGERFPSSEVNVMRMKPDMTSEVESDVESEGLVVDSMVEPGDNNNESGSEDKIGHVIGVTGLGGSGNEFSEPAVPRPPPTKRRVRRRATSSSDPAEALTEMSVRGLNLFRYASVTEGVYKCMECAKCDILKTFKNKYSFQRHAFLYHEGHQRKVFPCPVCAKEFSRPDKMKNHMKTVHDCFMPKECMFPPVGFYLPP